MYTHPSLLLLDSITCPALRSFSIIRLFRYVTNTSPLPFFERAPHIRAFAIQFYSRNSGIITAILSAMPAVTSLRVVAEATVTFDLLRLLSESPTFLPRITNIVLEPYTFVEWTDSEVKICMDAATSRWEAKSTAQVSDFELSYLNPPLDARVVACVSALKGKGMRIRVGPRHLTS
ncbi:hypothetical protein C8R46DRAFT_1071358 [Mycena filopes]|nr:hypothetical protein C8R46DRAFT_1071358 [Mycena filopes]